jgi:hypothetical protein
MNSLQTLKTLFSLSTISIHPYTIFSFHFSPSHTHSPPTHYFFRFFCTRHLHLYDTSPPLSLIPYYLCLLAPFIFHFCCTLCHTPFSYITHVVLVSTPIISMHFSIFVPFIPHHYLLFLTHSLNTL